MDKLLSKRSSHQRDMPFVEHLEELRWHLLRSVAAIVIGGVLIFIYRNELFDYVILAPLHKDFFSYSWMCKLGRLLGMEEYLCMSSDLQMKLQSTRLTGIFNTTLKISLIGGIILAFPYIFWELWRFIKPALQAKEKQHSTLFVCWTSFFFFLGLCFGYFVISPFTINFLFGFTLGGEGFIEIKPTIGDYIENFTTTVFGVALAFELPMVIYFLARMEIVGATQLRKFRKFAVLIVLLVAAIITPSPDWISQMIVALPLLLLYELSIVICTTVTRKKKDMLTSKWE